MQQLRSKCSFRAVTPLSYTVSELFPQPFSIPWPCLWQHCFLSLYLCGACEKFAAITFVYCRSKMCWYKMSSQWKLGRGGLCYTLLKPRAVTKLISFISLTQEKYKKTLRSINEKSRWKEISWEKRHITARKGKCDKAEFITGQSLLDID